MSKDFMHKMKTIELTKGSTQLSGNFNDLFLDILDRKIILVLSSSEDAMNKVIIYSQIGNYLVPADVLGTVIRGKPGGGVNFYYTKYDLTSIPVANISWECKSLDKGEEVTIQFLGGTF